MLKTRKYYREKAESLEFLNRGFSEGWENTGLGVGKRYTLDELSEIAEKEIEKAGLQVVDEKHAKIVCVVFAAYPDNEGYDVYGLSCYTNKQKPSRGIRYCGFCGDVNSFGFTDENSVKIFAR